ncbi:flagellar basal body rod protein FlgG [Gorillibacterium sp. sgz500922]|uniref:flagellar basal body rod protein FlgG n=1 Tax=Gorillibacterium sp. sgz500922 TaxID=3446694 RepID=UPI003F667111
MLRSLYSGISGMRGFQTKLDVIGNNIANVNTIGFKSGRVMFKDILSQTVAGGTPPTDATGGVNSKQVGLGVSIGTIDTVHTPGSAMTTNGPTDLRIDGDGFFAVKSTTDTDSIYLTRAGNFTLDSNRRLVNGDGMFVLASGGEPIQLEDTVTAFTIGQDGTINSIDADGNATPLDVKIGVVKVPNPGGLEKLGGNLYRPNTTAMGGENAEVTVGNAGEEGNGKIIAGQLEMSNVDLTSEFSEMIVAQRGFQANSRIITTSDEVLQEIVNLKR